MAITKVCADLTKAFRRPGDGVLRNTVGILKVANPLLLRISVHD